MAIREGSWCRELRNALQDPLVQGLLHTVPKIVWISAEKPSLSWMSRLLLKPNIPVRVSGPETRNILQNRSNLLQPWQARILWGDSIYFWDSVPLSVLIFSMSIMYLVLKFPILNLRIYCKTKLVFIKISYVNFKQNFAMYTYIKYLYNIYFYHIPVICTGTTDSKTF